jgi:uncharacterized damage-inducible protein DinB
VGRKNLSIMPLPGYVEEIGRWLWSLEDVRKTIKTKLTGISQNDLDSKMDGRESIGSLLYHIALIEADWLYEEVLVSEWDPQIRSLFPLEVLDENGFLVHIKGESLEAHFHRLDRVRSVLLSEFQRIDLSEWRRARKLQNYDVTPEWVIYHLIEHESHHRGQIFQLLSNLQMNKRV